MIYMNIRLFSQKENSITKLLDKLKDLTKELDETTEQLQLLEIQSDTQNIEKVNRHNNEEIKKLVEKQNILSYEIISIQKTIRKLRDKTIFKIELLVLPVVLSLLVYLYIQFIH